MRWWCRWTARSWTRGLSPSSRPPSPRLSAIRPRLPPPPSTAPTITTATTHRSEVATSTTPPRLLPDGLYRPQTSDRGGVAMVMVAQGGGRNSQKIVTENDELLWISSLSFFRLFVWLPGSLQSSRGRCGDHNLWPFSEFLLCPIPVWRAPFFIQNRGFLHIYVPPVPFQSKCTEMWR